MSAKRARTDERILAAWSAWADDDDLSTEATIQLTADQCGVDYGRVVDALTRKAGREGLIEQGQDHAR